MLKSKFLMGVMIVALLVVGFSFATTAKADDSCTLSIPLKVGVVSEQVECLQAKLGMTARSTHFGPLTLAAVKAYQANHSLTADGVVGPATRAALNGTAAAQGNCPTGYVAVTPVAPTWAACVVATPAQGSCPAGYVAITPAAPTWAACALSGAVATTGEGSVTVTYDAYPASGLAVNKGETKDVMTFKIKATGSDMKVSRFWADVNARIWLSASDAAIYDGSTLLETVPLSASTVVETTIGSAWQVQFNGLNVTIPAGQTKYLTLKITRPVLTNASDSITMAATSSFRATDGAGFTNTYTVSARTINLSGTSNASTGSLTNSLNANSPAAQSITGLSTTAGTLTSVKLMDFDLKAVDGPINVSRIQGTMTSTGTLAQDVASVELRDGANIIASDASTSVDGTPDFASLSIDIPANTTKTLSVWVKVNHVASSYVVKGDGISAVVNSITATTNGFATAVNNTTSVSGNIQYLFQYAPTLALGATSVSVVDTSTSTTVNNALNASLAFTVTAPSGSDIYVNGTDGLLCGGTYPITKIGNAACNSTTIGGTMTTALSVSGATSKGTGTLATWDKVAAGTSRTFTVTGYIPNGNAAGFTGMTMATNGLQWTDTDNVTISGVATTEQTWGLSDFKTPTAHVTAN